MQQEKGSERQNAGIRAATPNHVAVRDLCDWLLAATDEEASMQWLRLTADS